MKRAALSRLALAALSGAALAATPIGVAYAQDANAPLTVSIDASVCGQATITYASTNTLPYSGDYRVADEPGGPDQFSHLEVAEGPFAGQLFGPRFHPTAIPAGAATVPVVVELGEDQGDGEVSVAAWVNRGPEQKAYAAVLTAVVDTDCEPPVTTTPPTATPNETPAPVDEFDCADFPLADGRTVQDVLAADPADPNRLDLDGDGDACELDDTAGADTDDDGGDFDQVGTPPAGGVATGG